MGGINQNMGSLLNYHYTIENTRKCQESKVTFPKCDVKSQEHPLFEQEETTVEPPEKEPPNLFKDNRHFFSLNSVFSGNY